MIGCPLSSFAHPVHVSSYLRDYRSLYGFAHRFASSFRHQTLPRYDSCRSSASTTAASSDTSCKHACDWNWGWEGGMAAAFSQPRRSWPFGFGIQDGSGASSQMHDQLHGAGHYQRPLEAIAFASSTRPVSQLCRPRRGPIKLLRPRSMSL